MQSSVYMFEADSLDPLLPFLPSSPDPDPIPGISFGAVDEIQAAEELQQYLVYVDRETGDPHLCSCEFSVYPDMEADEYWYYPRSLSLNMVESEDPFGPCLYCGRPQILANAGGPSTYSPASRHPSFPSATIGLNAACPNISRALSDHQYCKVRNPNPANADDQHRASRTRREAATNTDGGLQACAQLAHEATGSSAHSGKGRRGTRSVAERTRKSNGGPEDAISSQDFGVRNPLLLSISEEYHDEEEARESFFPYDLEFQPDYMEFDDEVYLAYLNLLARGDGHLLEWFSMPGDEIAQNGNPEGCQDDLTVAGTLV